MRLAGQSVLVVEDEVLVGMFLVETVEDEGALAIGPAESARRALEILRTERVTAAILDVNLRDGEVTPVADWLVAHGVPFLVHSASAIPARLRPRLGAAPVIAKPSQADRLVEALAGAIEREAQRRAGTAAEGELHPAPP